jgi:hypothetical protein
VRALLRVGIVTEIIETAPYLNMGEGGMQAAARIQCTAVMDTVTT